MYVWRCKCGIELPANSTNYINIRNHVRDAHDSGDVSTWIDGIVDTETKEVKVKGWSSRVWARAKQNGWIETLGVKESASLPSTQSTPAQEAWEKEFPIPPAPSVSTPSDFLPLDFGPHDPAEIDYIPPPVMSRSEREASSRVGKVVPLSTKRPTVTVVAQNLVLPDSFQVFFQSARSAYPEKYPDNSSESQSQLILDALVVYALELNLPIAEQLVAEISRTILRDAKEEAEPTLATEEMDVDLSQETDEEGGEWPD